MDDNDIDSGFQYDNPSDTEDDTVTFMEITGATADTAARFLAIASDVQTAVMLYIESGGGMGQERVEDTGDLGGGNGHSGNGIDARSDNSRNTGTTNEELRAPIAPRRDVLSYGFDDNPFEITGRGVNSSSRNQNPFGL